jgi:hypothetical protein
MILIRNSAWHFSLQTTSHQLHGVLLAQWAAPTGGDGRHSRQSVKCACHAKHDSHKMQQVHCYVNSCEQFTEVKYACMI